MNVYDFDKTIYAGDSTIDFYLYCLRKRPKLITRAFTQAYDLSLYTLKRIDTNAFKSRFFSFLKNLDHLQELVSDFWVCNDHKIKQWYLNQKEATDVVVSASPKFLLEPICKKLGIGLIATDVDIYTGQLRGCNCKGKEKVRRFQAQYPDAIIHKFYSDSNSDAPLARLAREAFLVSGNKISLWSVANTDSNLS